MLLITIIHTNVDPRAILDKAIATVEELEDMVIPENDAEDLRVKVLRETVNSLQDHIGILDDKVARMERRATSPARTAIVLGERDTRIQNLLDT